MRAVILAGGRGTRLRPYTVTLPKPLVPVGDKPILEVIIRQLDRAGFDRVTISTGHLADLIQAYFGDGSKYGVAIDYVREDTPLSTAGALSLIADPDDHMLVMNGDVLTDLDFGVFMREHVERAAAATVSVARRTSLIDFGVVVEDRDGNLAEWIEKPEQPYLVSMGVYALTSAAVALVQPAEPLGMPDLLMRVVGDGGLVWCREHDGYWLDIGRPDDYEIAQHDFEQRREDFE
jgi:NDP-sugar pyrophosphorylase family protein